LKINDIQKIPICKELNYFRKIRKIEDLNFEKNFYENFKKEMENSINNSKGNINNINNNNNNNDFFDEYDNDNDDISILDMNEANEILNAEQENDSICSQISFEQNKYNSNGNLSESFNQIKPGLNQTSSFFDGISHLKSEDIKQHIEQFGDGNREIILNNFEGFDNFSRKFNQMDNNNWKITKLENNKNKEKLQKVKKEQILFSFENDNEITEDDFDKLFDKKKSKNKKKDIESTEKLFKDRIGKRAGIKKAYNYGTKA
jgi:hypothetical protein